MVELDDYQNTHKDYKDSGLFAHWRTKWQFSDTTNDILAHLLQYL